MVFCRTKVGADRLANAIAAYDLYGGPTVVVDFGTGSGVAAIAAGLAGADSVMGVDTDPEARAAAARNAASNDVELVTGTALPEEWDVLLACDVLYEPSQWARLRSLAQSGRPVLVSDPERPSSPRFEMAPQARYAVRTLPDVDSPAKSAAVFQLANPGVDPG